MELQLKNIGMIKEANVRIDGLTVIAGENDTGKSTVGKFLFKKVRESLFEGHKDIKGLIFGEGEEVQFPIFIDTPDLLAKFNYIKNTLVLVQQSQLNFNLPIEVTDLILRISQSSNRSKNIKDFQTIKSIISGEIYYDKSKDDIFYEKKGLKKRLSMSKTSSGIKMFGFFQMLILNESIQKNTVLILDEPEVHLHPKWQLKMAEFIVKLIKDNGVKVLVNSHSPYMIEALERYGEKSDINMDFYLAEDGMIDKIEDSNSLTLSKIFKKLSAPYETFDQMDSKTLQGG